MHHVGVGADCRSPEPPAKGICGGECRGRLPGRVRVVEPPDLVPCTFSCGALSENPVNRILRVGIRGHGPGVEARVSRVVRVAMTRAKGKPHGEAQTDMHHTRRGLLQTKRVREA